MERLDRIAICKPRNGEGGGGGGWMIIGISGIGGIANTVECLFLQAETIVGANCVLHTRIARVGAIQGSA
jgi:hypothetical protein